jgi:hypothetical protein
MIDEFQKVLDDCQSRTNRDYLPDVLSKALQNYELMMFERSDRLSTVDRREFLRRIQDQIGSLDPEIVTEALNLAKSRPERIKQASLICDSYERYKLLRLQSLIRHWILRPFSFLKAQRRRIHEYQWNKMET